MRPWALVTAALLAALLAAHGPSLAQAWRGEVAYSYAFDRCEGHFASEVAPAPRGAPSAEGCDTLYSQRMGWDGWRRFVEAWEGRDGIVGFFLVDVWGVATSARALNVLDLALFVWPAHLVLPPAAALVVVHVGLLALGVVSGVVFARALGASPAGGLAAGLVVGASGVVIESVQRGQYPQAVLAGALFFFAGLARMVRDERGGVALAAGGAALAALLYWQNAVILGLGAVIFLGGARLGGPFAPGAARRLGVAAVVSLAVALPAALPVLRAMASGAEEKVVVAPWGTPFPFGSTRPDALVDLIDEVPWFVLFAPDTGWLPVLPLLPLAIVGLAGRARAGWAGVAVVGALLALGPLPVVPEAPGFPAGRVVTGYGALPRVENPVYDAVYTWIPTASRQRHPMRWATLLVVGMAAAAALGADRLRARWPDHVWIALVTGVGWAAWVGPWPLRQAAFPQEVVDAFAGCDALVLPGLPRGDRAYDDVHRLEGLLWLPRAPVTRTGTGGVGAPTPGMQSWSDTRAAALATALAGGPVDAVLDGACVLVEPSWFHPDGARLRDELVAAFGEPAFTLVPTGLFSADGTSRRLEVFVPHAAAAP